jgi:hypothetical protein
MAMQAAGSTRAVQAAVNQVLIFLLFILNSRSSKCVTTIWAGGLPVVFS